MVEEVKPLKEYMMKIEGRLEGGGVSAEMRGNCVLSFTDITDDNEPVAVCF